MSQRRFSRWVWLLPPAAIVIAIALFWNWDWFIPLIESQASSAAGRQVKIAHLHVHLGRVTEVELDGINVASPEGFAAPLATVGALKIQADVMNYIHNRTILLPLIEVDQPVIDAEGTKRGTNNYMVGGNATKSDKPATVPPQIGDLVIRDGHVTFADPKLQSRFTLKVHTEKADGTIAAAHQLSQIAVNGGGTYRGQPIDVDFKGGALLSLRDAGAPYPLSLHIANGATNVALNGSIQDPMAFKGANLKLLLSGASMSDLFPLTGIPIPATPSYKISGHLDYKKGRIRFEQFEGLVGHSDLGGTITEDAGRERPDVTMDLESRNVDLADLGGFIGTTPGDKGGKTPSDVAASKQGKGTLLPSQPFNMPKIKAADIHLKYRGAHIEGQSVPFDTLSVNLDVVNGNIALHPVIFGVGTGRIMGNIDLQPQPNDLIHAKLDVDFQRVDLGRMMRATHAFGGEGRIGGKARIDATGNSVATWLGSGDGGLALYMAGGDLSSLLMDLSGFQFGNALVSALGLPTRTDVECFIGDFRLRDGIVNTQALLLETKSSVLQGRGSVNLRQQTIDYSLKTDSKHFSIGSLPAPIDITGKLNSPSIRPDLAVLGARGGAAAALGFLAPPLALLPTIQLGVDDTHQCSGLLERVKTQVHQDMPGGKSSLGKH